MGAALRRDGAQPSTARCSQAPHAALLLLALAARGAPGASAKELTYPEGVRPGDQVSGAEGEYFRYKTVLVKPPDDEDRVESLRMAGDVMCAACEVMLQSLARRAESLSEDHIMDQLDGELAGPVAPVDDPQENRVNQNRRGCNKHFKDELLLRGYVVRRCSGAAAAAAGGGAAPAAAAPPPAWCLERLPSAPAERDVDTYSQQNEAAFHACENTVGRHGQELAAFVAEHAESAEALPEVAARACREAARCEGAAGRRGGKRRGRRRGRRGAGGGEL